MINLIGILCLIIILATLIASMIVFYQHKINIIDNDLSQRDKELGDKTMIIQKKNLIIKDKDLLIKQLQEENNQLKKQCRIKNNKNTI